MPSPAVCVCHHLMNGRELVNVELMEIQVCTVWKDTENKEKS